MLMLSKSFIYHSCRCFCMCLVFLYVSIITYTFFLHYIIIICFFPPFYFAVENYGTDGRDNTPIYSLNTQRRHCNLHVHLCPDQHYYAFYPLLLSFLIVEMKCNTQLFLVPYILNESKKTVEIDCMFWAW